MRASVRLETDGHLFAIGNDCPVVDARRTEWAAEVGERSRRDLGSASLAEKKGCRTAVELIQRVTRASGATACYAV